MTRPGIPPEGVAALGAGVSIASNLVRDLVAESRPQGRVQGPLANAWIATMALCLVDLARRREFRRRWLVAGTVLSAAANLASTGETEPAEEAWRFGQAVSVAIAASATAPFSPPTLAAVTTIAATWLTAGYIRKRRCVAGPTPTLTPVIDLLGTSLGVSLASRQLHRFEAEVRRLDEQAQEQAAVAAVEAERARQHKILHDTVLQTLEGVAGDWQAGDEQLRLLAAADAARLRSAIAGADETPGLAAALTDLADLYRDLGLDVDLYLDADGSDRSIPAETTEAFSAAAREALQNVLKHAGPSRVWVRASAGRASVTVTVRDDGAGFDPALVCEGFGLGESIRARMAGVCGSADVESEPGLGTTVSLRAPLP